MKNRTYNGIEYPNRQLKNWFAILYPNTNESHSVALDLLDFAPECLMMCHDRSINKDGTPKEIHYHVWLHYDNPKWLYTILKEYKLGDDSLHLFKSFDEIKRKTWTKPDDYVVYMTHIKEEDKEVYDYHNFLGGRRLYGVELCGNIELSDQDRINKCLNDIKALHDQQHLNLRYLEDIYFDLVKMGNGKILNQKWNFFYKFIADKREH